MVTVKNPPVLVAQETPAWCFAAAEEMIRQYYSLPSLSQYAIARAILLARVEAQDPQILKGWQQAEAADQKANRQEEGGKNGQSAIVKMVQAQYGEFNYHDTKGTLKSKLTPADVMAQINAQKIFVVGDHQHFLVVYGYSDEGATLLVRDPMKAKTSVALSDMMKSYFIAVVY